jgi:hypothetical protein
MLLDPFEEEFDLPAVLVKESDLVCTQVKVIGEENKSAIGFFIKVLDCTQLIWIIL